MFDSWHLRAAKIACLEGMDQRGPLNSHSHLHAGKYMGMVANSAHQPAECL